MKVFHLYYFIVFICLGFSSEVFAWGERGHHTVCEVASRLVENKELSFFLHGRGHLSGHVCNIPDIHWKDLSSHTKIIGASHFMNPENFGYQISEVPLSFKKIVSDQSDTSEHVADKLGTLWWRAEQFYRRAVDGAKRAKASDFPEKNQSQDNNHPYNKGIYDFMVNLSLMGHYVGDASVPFHNTSDYDGWEKGKGGIHAYYESYSVEAMGMDLSNQVFEEALKLRGKRAGSKNKSNQAIVEAMKELSEASTQELAKVHELDVVLSPSDKGSKSYAKRPPSEKGAEAFGALIVSQMARSSLALANFWEQAWTEGGEVSFKGYRSFKYPLAPELVELDYLKN